MGVDPGDHRNQLTSRSGFDSAYVAEDPDTLRPELAGNAKDFRAVRSKYLGYAEPVPLRHRANLGGDMKARLASGAYGGHPTSHAPRVDTTVAVSHTHHLFQEHFPGKTTAQKTYFSLSAELAKRELPVVPVYLRGWDTDGACVLLSLGFPSPVTHGVMENSTR